MRSQLRALALATCLSGSAAPGLTAQELSEVCPDAPDGSAAIWGSVKDSESGVVMPAADVIASWTHDGSDGQMAAQAGFDGSYVLCGLPSGAEISLVAAFATMGGPVVTYTTSDPVGNVDLGVSLTAAPSGGGIEDLGDRLMMCSGPNTQGPRPDIEHPMLFFCDPAWQLEKCAANQIRLVTASRTGAGSETQELMERFHLEAQRAGANAIVNLQVDLAQDQFTIMRIMGMAAVVENPNC